MITDRQEERGRAVMGFFLDEVQAATKEPGKRGGKMGKTWKARCEDTIRALAKTTGVDIYYAKKSLEDALDNMTKNLEATATRGQYLEEQLAGFDDSSPRTKGLRTVGEVIEGTIVRNHIRNLSPSRDLTPPLPGEEPGWCSRWVILEKDTLCGASVAKALCTKYGFDPEEVLYPKENLQ